ncbi:unnamed protein product [Ectocarpus sp. 13 AM-2016]
MTVCLLVPLSRINVVHPSDVIASFFAGADTGERIASVTPPSTDVELTLPCQVPTRKTAPMNFDTAGRDGNIDSPRRALHPSNVAQPKMLAEIGIRALNCLYRTGACPIDRDWQTINLA